MKFIFTDNSHQRNLAWRKNKIRMDKYQVGCLVAVHEIMMTEIYCLVQMKYVYIIDIKKITCQKIYASGLQLTKIVVVLVLCKIKRYMMMMMIIITTAYLYSVNFICVPRHKCSTALPFSFFHFFFYFFFIKIQYNYSMGILTTKKTHTCIRR